MAISKNPFSLYFPIKLGCLNIFIFIDENLFVKDEECFSRPHSHHTYEIRYNENGHCSPVIDGAPLSVKAHEALLVRPGEYHYQPFSDTNGTTSQYSMRFRIEALPGNAPTYQQTAYRRFLDSLQKSRLVSDKKDVFSYLFRSLKNEMLEKEAGYIYNLQHLSTLILTEFIRYTGLPIDAIFPPEDIKYRGLMITKMEQFFSWRYADNVKIQDLADDIMVSKRQAARILHQIYGMPFSQKMTEVRLQHAAYQLKNTDLKTEEISERCGFNNSSYFYMSFRKKYNMTPSEFRKNQSILPDPESEESLQSPNFFEGEDHNVD